MYGNTWGELDKDPRVHKGALIVCIVLPWNMVYVGSAALKRGRKTITLSTVSTTVFVLLSIVQTLQC